MTVAAASAKAGPFPGNDSASSFAFEFKVFAATDIRVVETLISTGVESDLVLNTNYTVTLNNDQDNQPGGSITYKVGGVTTALPSTKKLTIVGDFDYAQPTDIPNGGKFFAQIVENALDRCTLLIKQLAEKVDRAVTVDVSSSLSPSQLIADLTTNAANAASSAAAAEASATSAGSSASDAALSAASAAASASTFTTVDAQIHAAVSKVLPVDADEIGIWDSVSAALRKLTWANLKATLIGTAMNWLANQRPNYDASLTVSGGGSLTYNGATMAQIQGFTLSGPGGVTFAAPSNIVEGMPYALVLIEGDATVRAYSYNAAFVNSASMPTSSVGAAGKKTTLNFIGGPSNTLIFNGGTVGS